MHGIRDGRFWKRSWHGDAAYFGRENLPRLQSFASSATVLGSALGPFPFGVIHDYYGRFDIAMYASSLLTLVAAFAVSKYGDNPSLETRYEMVKNQEAEVELGERR